MADMSESLFQAIDTIVSKRLQAINFDNTDIYSIVDASKADLGKYKVTDGNVTFTAYSTNTDYKEDEAVYVTIPNNDFNQQKLIIGKYTANSETPFVFTNPTSTMIDVTGNLIHGEIAEGQLTANSINKEEWPNEEEILLWTKDCQNQNYIGFERLGIKGNFKSWLGDFDCVQGHYGLKIKLYCVNNDTYSNKTHYEMIRDKCESNSVDDRRWAIYTSGIANSVDLSSADTDERKIQIILDYVNEKLSELFVAYELKLDSNDMIGDPYNFVDYHRQEQVFNISRLGQILKIELWFYQNPGSFYDVFGEPVPYLEDDGFTDIPAILPRNLFTIEPYLMLGFDLNNFNGEQALLTSTDSLTYKQQDSVDSITTEEDTYNKKYIHLSWLHEGSKGIVNIESDTDVDGTYYINWYQKSAGAPSPDEWAGVEWKLLSQDGEENNLGPHTFNFTLVINQDSYDKAYEQIKAIIVYTSSTGNTTAIHSNIITFSNENDIVNNAAVDLGRGLTINCLDGTNGVYYIYRQDYNLIDSAKGDEYRRLECQLYSKEFGLEGPLKEAKSITWRIPATNTMIKVISNGAFDNFDYNGVGLKYTQTELLKHFGVDDVSQLQGQDLIDYNRLLGTSKEADYYGEEKLYNSEQELTAIDIESLTDYKDKYDNSYKCKTTGYLYDIENKEIVITWFGNEENGYQINPYFDYLISKNYLQNNTNNTITCIVNKNNREYVGSITLRFGTAGTNGTAYTLVVEMVEYKTNQNNTRTIINENKKALTKNTNNENVAFVARIYDTSGQEIDLYNNENFEKLKFTWTLGHEKNIASYYDTNTNINLNYYDTTNLSTLANNGNWNIAITRNPKTGPGVLTYYRSVSPNYIILQHTNLTMNNLLYLDVKLQGWGDYTLETVYPIPIRSNDAPYKNDEENYRYEVDHINGPTYICYPPDGYPEFYNNPFTLYEVEYDKTTNVITDKDIQVDSVIWGVGHEIGTYNEYYEVYHPHLTLPANPTQSQLNKYNKDLVYLPVISKEKVLRPLDFYIENQLPYGVQAVYGANEIVWTQPIWTYQNDYGSTTLNEWNGKGVQIDEEKGTIVSRGIAAGKKESDNSFTGVIIGDWSASGDNHEVLSTNTGVYGFEHGAMAYAFKDDGTAFIGKSGKGRILFDGNDASITSDNYKAGLGGTYIDLSDPYQEFKNGGFAQATINSTTQFNEQKNSLYVAVRDANNNLTSYRRVRSDESYESGTAYYKVNGYFIQLNARSNNLNLDDNALSIGVEGNPNFRVQWDGSLYAANADIQGFIHGSTININNGAFLVSNEGVTFMENLNANIANINDGDISGVMHIKNGSELLGTLDANSGTVLFGDYLNPTIYGPNIHLYFSAGSYQRYSYAYVEVYTYDPSIRTYYIKATDMYGAAGKPNVYVNYTINSQSVFDAAKHYFSHIYVYTRLANESSTSSSGGDGQTSIRMYTGSGKDNPEKYIGFFGMAGSSSDGYTAGIDLTGHDSGVTYGLAFKSTGGNIISTNGSGHVYLATSGGTCQLMLSNDNTGAKKGALLRGTSWEIYLDDTPLVRTAGATSGGYDLRYAYFA